MIYPDNQNKLIIEPNAKNISIEPLLYLQSTLESTYQKNKEVIVEDNLSFKIEIILDNKDYYKIKINKINIKMIDHSSENRSEKYIDKETFYTICTESHLRKMTFSSNKEWYENNQEFYKIIYKDIVEPYIQNKKRNMIKEINKDQKYICNDLVQYVIFKYI